MAIEKQEPRQLQPTEQVSRDRPQLRERHAATIAPSASTLSIPSGSGAEASSATTSCLSQGISKAEQEESVPHRPIKEGTRLIRVRMSHSRRVVYSADDPTGTLRASTSREPVRFGGVFSGYDSNIVISSPRDLVYFDKIPNFIRMGLSEALSTAPSEPSGMAFVAINLAQFAPVFLVPFICTVDNDDLSGIVLVVTKDDIRDLVEYAESDEWGFREVPEGDLRSSQPALYEKGMELVDSFNNLREEEEEEPLDHMFVYDWDRRGSD
ncbi:hypothetical protein GQX73_g3192 [Xylaria multiplex]|uniref:Uncharacterized protein n=1 Tax=Xylaria multiplex TaxID=323545 RepID=A0A7C8IU75_9PEZI|nr:hypothetical protein GQX73_g3192 [Xylaria multiplex]